MMTRRILCRPSDAERNGERRKRDGCSIILLLPYAYGWREGCGDHGQES